MKTYTEERKLAAHIQLVSVSYQYDNDAHDEKASLNIQTLTHNPTDCLGNTDSSLSYDDDGEQTHALHEMGLLEAEHTPAARNCYDNDGFGDHNGIPDHI
jgi:hypothetical protein